MQFAEMVIKCVLSGFLWLSSRAHSLFKSTYRIFARAFENKRVRCERLRRGRGHPSGAGGNLIPLPDTHTM